MGRPRGFDEEQVLREATRLFGRRGYDAVAVDTLVEVLGLSRASLYKIYGSKQGLLRAALEDVCARAGRGDVDDASRDLVLVALLELAPGDAVIRDLADQALRPCFDDDPARVGHHLIARARIPR